MKHQPSQHCQRSTPTLHIDVSPLAAIPKTHAPHITHRDYGSAVYHCFVTATTVGYGDTSITTAEGQARAAALTQPLSRDGNSSLLPSTTFHPRLLASSPPTLLPSYPPTLLPSYPPFLLTFTPPRLLSSGLGDGPHSAVCHTSRRRPRLLRRAPRRVARGEKVLRHTSHCTLALEGTALKGHCS